MQKKHDDFAETFSRLLDETGYTPGQLGQRSGLPKTTLINWRNGRVRRPRHWQDLVQVALAMRLNADETDALLTAAGHPTLSALRLESDNKLLQEFDINKIDAPFQAVQRNPYFVGRQAEIEQLTTWLTAVNPRPVLLQGMAGVGKTAVAIELAYCLRNHFVDGVLWARLDVSEALSILRSFAEAYGRDLRDYSDVDSRGRIVRSLLQNKRTLIILDNAENAEQLLALLPPTGHCAVLITSQQQDLLLLQGAHRLTLRPFPEQSPVIKELFQRYLGGTWVAENETAVFHIADQLGNHPLAIAIAAGRMLVERWSAERFLQQLAQKSLARLTVAGVSLLRALQLSYERLSAEQRTVFQATAVAGVTDVGLDAIVAVSQGDSFTVETILHQLAALSLVEWRQAKRIQMHPLLRQFALDTVEDETVWLCMVEYYVNEIEAHGRDYSTLAAELNNILAAFTWAAQHGLADWLQKGVTAVVPAFIVRGEYDLIAPHLQTVLAQVQQSGDVRGEVIMRRYCGQIARHQQALDTAVTHFEEAYRLAQQCQDIYLQTAVLTELGVTAACQENPTQTVAYFEQALPTAKKHGYADLLAIIYAELGIAAVFVGTAVAAKTYFEDGLRLARQTDDAAQTVLMLKSLGALSFLTKDWGQADQYFVLGLDGAQQIHFRKGIAYLLNNQAVLAVAQGHEDVAKAKLATAVTLAAECDDPKLTEIVVQNAENLSKRGEPERLKMFI